MTALRASPVVGLVRRDVGRALCLAALAVVGAACAKAEAVSTELRVEGMTCDSCVQAITAALGQLDGVTAVEVSLAKRRAVVRHIAAKVPAAKLIAEINKLGYRASLASGPSG